MLELVDSTGSVAASRTIDSSIGTGSLTFDFNNICDVERIKVSIPGDDKVLSLAEVKAWGYGTTCSDVPRDDMVLIEPGFPTEQSSTGHGGYAQRAIDG